VGQTTGFKPIDQWDERRDATRAPSAHIGGAPRAG
jgi:hypothetical protein